MEYTKIEIEGMAEQNEKEGEKEIMREHLLL